MKAVTLVQLNEINFSIVRKYIDDGYKLDYFKKILDTSIDTYEDETYRNLEPWIQWISIFNGKSFKEHGVFHLGDGKNINSGNIFSDVTNLLGMSCGAIAPMNIYAKDIRYDYFIPDPWSDQAAKGKKRLKLIFKAIQQGVNDNSGKGINFINKIFLLSGLFLTLKPIDIQEIFIYYLTINNKSYRKAIFLDYILVLLEQRLSQENNTEFSTVFLNAGAHIQHHYLFNSKVLLDSLKYKNPEWYIKEGIDPLGEVLIFYNKILESYEKIGKKIILMTGLQQVPCEKIEFYYRLSNHDKFFKYLGIEYKKILPRMTRDFEIQFETNKDRDECKNKLTKIIDNNGIKVFNELDIRDKSIFCTLTYSDEITSNVAFKYGEKNINLAMHTNFVAVKNGKHDRNGKLFISDRDLSREYCKPIELRDIRKLIISDIQSTK